MSALNSPLTLSHGPDWPNRIALAPMTNRQSNADGTLSEHELVWLERRALGGFGLVMTAAAHVSPSGQGWTGQLGIFDDRQLPGLRRLADALRLAGSRSAVQLHHGGLRAERTVVDQILAPWDDPQTAARALTTGEIHRIVQDFVDAAARAERAGFDGVEIHGAHGYLVAQFLDSDRNLRTDGYGTTYDGRARFLREIVAGIRASTSEDFQLGLRLSPERNGVRLADATRLSAEMMQSGDLAYLDMSLWDVTKQPYEDGHGPELLITHFTRLDRGTTRLGVAGKIHSAADALACLERGVDFVSIGSAAILHHDFAARAALDPAFAAVTPPVTAEHLRGESLSDGFIDYLTEIKKGWILDR